MKITIKIKSSSELFREGTGHLNIHSLPVVTSFSIRGNDTRYVTLRIGRKKNKHIF